MVERSIKSCGEDRMLFSSRMRKESKIVCDAISVAVVVLFTPRMVDCRCQVLGARDAGSNDYGSLKGGG